MSLVGCFGAVIRMAAGRCFRGQWTLVCFGWGAGEVKVVLLLFACMLLIVGGSGTVPVLCASGSSLATVTRLGPPNTVIWRRRRVCVWHVGHISRVFFGVLGPLSLGSVAGDFALWERCRVRHGAFWSEPRIGRRDWQWYGIEDRRKYLGRQ